MLKLFTSLAHPGHGTTDPSSWRHYLTEPLHVVVIAGAALLVVEVVLWRVRRRSALKRD
jgi:hypothetical protein